MQDAAALRPIRFQFANSSPRRISLPADEIATSRKAQASTRPATCRRGRIDPSAPKAGSRSIQNNNSLQYPVSSLAHSVLGLLLWISILIYPLFDSYWLSCKIDQITCILRRVNIFGYWAGLTTDPSNVRRVGSLTGGAWICRPFWCRIEPSDMDSYDNAAQPTRR